MEKTTHEKPLYDKDDTLEDLVKRMDERLTGSLIVYDESRPDSVRAVLSGSVLTMGALCERLAAEVTKLQKQVDVLTHLNAG